LVLSGPGEQAVASTTIIAAAEMRAWLDMVGFLIGQR